MTMDDYELHRWMEEQAAYNDSFVGEVLNEAKLDKLNRMKRGCGELAKADPDIEAPFAPFDYTCRNGMAYLDIPVVYFSTDANVRERLASLIAASDDIGFSALDGEHIRISFGVHDMWDKFRHEGYECNE